MKNILLFVLTFLLILTISGCRVRLAADRDAVPDSGTVSPQNDFPGNAYRSDAQNVAADAQDIDSGSDENAGDQGQTVENPEAARKEYDENGEGWITDESYEETGYFYLNGSGQLCWHDGRAGGGEDSVFLRVS